MKLYLCVTTFLVIFCTVSSKIRTPPAPTGGIEIEPIKYSGNETFLKAGTTKKLICKGTSKSQQIDWYDPYDNIIKRRSNTRFQVQDAMMSSNRGSVRGLVLQITDAEVKDSGMYSCKSGGTVKEIAVCILDPVKFLNNETEITMDEGRSITLACKYEGDDNIVTWSRNGVNIYEDDQSSSKYQVMTSYQSYWMEDLLTITSLQVEDQGEYTCEAFQANPNIEGCNDTKSITFNLNVRHKPKFDVENETFAYSYGAYNDSVRLECKADAYPDATYRWFHLADEVLSEFSVSEINLTDDNTAILNVTADSSTFGEVYVCKASNLYGDAYLKVKVLELTKPSKPLDVEVLNATNATIEFHLSWDGDQLFPIDQISVQYMEKTTELKPKEYQWRKAKRVMIDYVNQLTLSDLTPESEYWVRMNIMNEAGQSGWTVPLAAETTSSEELVPSPESHHTSQTIYGEVIFGFVITCGVILFAVACVLVVKRV